jgi:hypothetical protein
MPRGGAIIVGALIGKLDVLPVAGDKCERKGRCAAARLTVAFGAKRTTTKIGLDHLGRE